MTCRASSYYFQVSDQLQKETGRLPYYLEYWDTSTPYHACPKMRACEKLACLAISVDPDCTQHSVASDLHEMQAIIFSEKKKKKSKCNLQQL